MSSREIAELTDKRHDNVMAVCRSLKESGVCPEIQETPYINEQNGQQYLQCVLSKRDSLVLVARLSPEFTARIVDRWQELESQSAGAFKIPGTLSEALRLAVEVMG
jgi:phage regulator Rha-like protein